MIVQTLKKAVKKILRYPTPYTFFLMKEIQHQSIRFRFRNREFVLESDGSTPLYETICEIADYDAYQLDRVDFSNFDHNSIALDVGGNIGVFSILFSAIFPGKILCFEPLAENCAFLEHNLKLNGVKNVEVHPKALTVKEGPLPFFKGEGSVSGSIFQWDERPSLVVQGTSVQNLMKQYPQIDFVKMDCEGGEYELIPALLEHAERIRYLSAEIHNIDRERRLATMTSALERGGYFVHLKPEQHRRRELTCLFAEKP